MISKNRPPKKASVVPADESQVDASVEMTFPASDPPAVGGVTKLKNDSSTETGPDLADITTVSTENNAKRPHGQRKFAGKQEGTPRQLK